MFLIIIASRGFQARSDLLIPLEIQQHGLPHLAILNLIQFADSTFLFKSMDGDFRLSPLLEGLWQPADWIDLLSVSQASDLVILQGGSGQKSTRLLEVKTVLSPCWRLRQRSRYVFCRIRLIERA